MIFAEIAAGTTSAGKRGIRLDKKEIINRLKDFPYSRDEYWVITGSDIYYQAFCHGNWVRMGAFIRIDEKG